MTAVEQVLYDIAAISHEIGGVGAEPEEYTRNLFIFRGESEQRAGCYCMLLYS